MSSIFFSINTPHFGALGSLYSLFYFLGSFFSPNLGLDDVEHPALPLMAYGVYEVTEHLL
jgi:hypothetical protein